MTPIRSIILKTLPDSPQASQTSNGVYPVRLQKTIIKRCPSGSKHQVTNINCGTEVKWSLMG